MTKKLEIRKNMDFSLSNIGTPKDKGYITRYRLVRKKYVFSKYSDGDISCVCCGCPFIEYLSLDHIEGGFGRKHRKLTNRNLFGWAIKNNFPPIFQILCNVCNASKGMTGKCNYHEFVPKRNWEDSRLKTWVKEHEQELRAELG